MGLRLPNKPEPQCFQTGLKYNVKTSKSKTFLKNYEVQGSNPKKANFFSVSEKCRVLYHCDPQLIPPNELLSTLKVICNPKSLLILTEKGSSSSFCSSLTGLHVSIVRKRLSQHVGYF